MPLETFEKIAAQAGAFARMLSLHVLGEPFMHPDLPEILRACSRLGLRVNLVTNGTLLDNFGPAIFGEKCLAQVSVSLHALSSLPPAERIGKLNRLTDFAAHRPGGLIVGFRLRGSEDDPFVKETANFILKAFNAPAERAGAGGSVTLRDNVYLNFGKLFDWPGSGPGKIKKGCLGLRHHFAVLCTGEVVPCCADHSGRLAIGNINAKPLADILCGPAADGLRDSIAGMTPMPSYCASCGFSAP